MNEMKVEKRVMSTKGRVVIPGRLRRRLRIKRGTLVSFLEDNGRLIVQPITAEFIASLRGSLKGNGALRRLLTERRRES